MYFPFNASPADWRMLLYFRQVTELQTSHNLFLLHPPQSAEAHVTHTAMCDWNLVLNFSSECRFSDGNTRVKMVEAVGCSVTGEDDLVVLINCHVESFERGSHIILRDRDN